MDMMTLALAKKYTDEKVGSGGGSGGNYEIPIFELWSMGLPALTMDGKVVNAYTDTTELMKALLSGSVMLGFKVNMGAEATVYAIMNSADVSAMGQTQATGIFVGETPYLVLLRVEHGHMQAQLIELAQAGAGLPKVILDMGAFGLAEYELFSGTDIPVGDEVLAVARTAESSLEPLYLKFTDSDGNSYIRMEYVFSSTNGGVAIFQGFSMLGWRYQLVVDYGNSTINGSQNSMA